MRYLISFLIIIFLPSMVRAEACQGAQCECFKGYCWAYKYMNSVSGDPWCYTQRLCASPGACEWATYLRNSDCSWEMTCGNSRLYFGADESHSIDYPGAPFEGTISEGQRQVLKNLFRSKLELKLQSDKYEKLLKKTKKQYDDLLARRDKKNAQEIEFLRAVILELCSKLGINPPESM